MKRIIRLTESDLTRIVKQVIQEQSEHVKNLYKSWANKRSGNPEEALKLMDDVFKYQKKLSKKDFAQYSSYEELRRDLVKIKSEERSTDATKLYEDGELLVLAANTYEASCKYGAGSKWCTTARDTDSDWNRHNQTGTEFFWIFKNKPQDDPNHKFSYHVRITGEPDWCNAVNNCMSTRRLPEESYPKQHPKYNEIIEKLQEFHNARDMKNVNQISNTQTVQFENQRTIEELINENVPQIMRLLMDNGINETIMDNYEMSIESYLDSEVYDNLPDDLYDYDYDYDDAIEEYISDLEKYLQSKDIITFDRDMFYDMIGDLSYLVYNFLLDRNNFNAGEYFDEQDIDIVGVINDLINDNNYRNQYEEVIHEVVSLVASDEIYFAANNFRDKFEK
jgi:hypothetical protein